MKKALPVALGLVLLSGCGAEPEATPEVTVTVTTSVEAKESPSNDASPEESEAHDAEGEVVEGEGILAWTLDDGPVTLTCPDVDSGIVYRINLPADEAHESIQRMEGLREQIGIEAKPGYLVVEVDATAANSEVTHAGVYMATWATVEYESVDASGANDMVDKWSEEHLSANADTALYNEAVAVHNELIATAPNRGGKGFVLLATDEPITSIVAPAVQRDMFSFAVCDAA